MPFQKVNVLQNYDLKLSRPKPCNAGFDTSKKDDSNKPRFFPKTYYKYHDKFYAQDKDVLEYNHSIVFKKLVNVLDEKDVVIFYDKKTFDIEVERVKSYRKPSKSITSNNRTDKRVMVVHKEKNDDTRTVSDSDINEAFELI